MSQMRTLFTADFFQKFDFFLKWVFLQKGEFFKQVLHGVAYDVACKVQDVKGKIHLSCRGLNKKKKYIGVVLWEVYRGLEHKYG